MDPIPKRSLIAKSGYSWLYHYQNAKAIVVDSSYPAMELL